LELFFVWCIEQNKLRRPTHIAQLSSQLSSARVKVTCFDLKEVYKKAPREYFFLFVDDNRRA
jgi:hypothetical protein